MNKQEIPEYAFILAAGKGTRLRPYTDNMPKPMVPVNGRPLLSYTLENLKNVGVKHVTVNSFYLGNVIENYLQDYKEMDIYISKEDDLLDTGGGVKKSLHTMNNQPFYLINGDALWTDFNEPALMKLGRNWDQSKMDILLLLQDVKKMTLTNGIGDYNIHNINKAVRSLDKTGRFMFGGIRIVNPAVFNNEEEKKFSFLKLMDRAEKYGKLYAVQHEGEWHHISTPTELERVDKEFKTRTAAKAVNG